MKKILLPVFACASLMASAQNNLLQNPTTGNIPVADIKSICMASNGTNVVLIAASNDAVYAIDINDKNAAEAAANLVTTIPNFVADKLNPVTGQNSLQVMDMEVNPISRSVYVLASSGQQRYIVKVKNNGANVSLVNLNNVSYSKLTWGGQGFEVNDMIFGNNTLYIASGSFQLNGEIGWAAPPFANNAAFTKRATTMFKSNWGGQYTTTAPLETLAFGKIDNKNRLMGVTTCAPGFSIDAATLQGAGTLQVTEDFNVQFGTSKRVISMNHDSNNFLFDLHDGSLYRIGKKYIDGSQVTANNNNNNADELRDPMGNVPNTYAATEMKKVNDNGYDMMAKWDEYRLLMLESGNTGKLILSQMSVENPPADPTGIRDFKTANIELYPNPVQGSFTLSLGENQSKAVLKIISMNGRTVLMQDIKDKTSRINTTNIVSGIYTAVLQFDNGQVASQKLTVE